MNGNYEEDVLVDIRLACPYLRVSQDNIILIFVIYANKLGVKNDLTEYFKECCLSIVF